MTSPTPAPVPFPDIEAVLVPWLAAQMQSVFGVAVRTCTETPEDLADIVPVVAVYRAAGADVMAVLDRPVVDIDCFAATRLQAQAIGAQVHTLMHNYLPGVAGNAVVGAVNTVKSPGWLGYQDENIRRCNATYELFTHPIRT